MSCHAAKALPLSGLNHYTGPVEESIREAEALLQHVQQSWWRDRQPATDESRGTDVHGRDPTSVVTGLLTGCLNTLTRTRANLARYHTQADASWVSARCSDLDLLMIKVDMELVLWYQTAFQTCYAPDKATNLGTGREAWVSPPATFLSIGLPGH